MSYEGADAELRAQCDRVYDSSSELSVILGETVEKIMELYQSPFYRGPNATDELVVVPYSIRFGAAVRYCEIGEDPEMEPRVHYNFAPHFSFVKEYWRNRLRFDVESLTPGDIWWSNIIPGAMQVGYDSIGIARQVPSSHP